MALKDRLAAANSKIITAACAPGYSATNLQTSSDGMGGAMWTRIMAQSAEDGTMPLLEACYGPSTESGDFWEPSLRGNMVGPAVKVKLTEECVHEASRDMLWKLSEEAIGSKWEV